MLLTPVVFTLTKVIYLGSEVIKLLLCCTKPSMKLSLLINANMVKNKDFSCFHTLFIMLINVIMPTIVGIFTFINMINSMSMLVEHVKCFITSGLDSNYDHEMSLSQIIATPWPYLSL